MKRSDIEYFVEVRRAFCEGWSGVYIREIEHKLNPGKFVEFVIRNFTLMLERSVYCTITHGQTTETC